MSTSKECHDREMNQSISIFEAIGDAHRLFDRNLIGMIEHDRFFIKKSTMME
jgi:hypothetical protein